MSDAFLVPDETGGFEWTATVVNINPGYNKELFARCGILREYVAFCGEGKNEVSSNEFG